MAGRFFDDVAEDSPKCVVLCAGKGTRLRPHSERLPKVMLPLKGRPLLAYVIEYWAQYTTEFIFVVGYKKEKVIDFVEGFERIEASFVEQKELNGIADALTYTEDLIDDRFMVVLGDCLVDGEFDVPPDLEQGIGVSRTDREEKIKQNYSVEIEEESIVGVVEKPTELVNDLCGMGVYLFHKKLFDYIEKTPPSDRTDQVEITDVIQTMVDHGEDIKPLRFDGTYINVNTPKDLRRARDKDKGIFG
ncbi:MAG: sugar phosphate nucleotidyltransferase [Candidatus Aenigmatarchaeota archaeon]